METDKSVTSGGKPFQCKSKYASRLPLQIKAFYSDSHHTNQLYFLHTPFSSCILLARSQISHFQILPTHPPFNWTNNHPIPLLQYHWCWQVQKRHLRSLPKPIIQCIRTVTMQNRTVTMQKRAFAHAGLTLWNTIPVALRSRLMNCTSDIVKKHLKSFLFAPWR